MNYLGIDYGDQKIGLAISAGELSRPFLVLKVEEMNQAIEKIKEICEKEEIGMIILGFPEQDLESRMAQKIEFFRRKLKEKIGLPIDLEDETFTSKEALWKMIEVGKGRKKRKKEDAFAAAIILQSYLDRKEGK